MSKGHCDGCDKERSDVRSCGQDANGDPDAPDLCFICRKEAGRGCFYDRRLGRYVRPEQSWSQVRGEAKASLESLEDWSSQSKERITQRMVIQAVASFGSHLTAEQQHEMVVDLWGVLRR